MYDVTVNGLLEFQYVVVYENICYLFRLCVRYGDLQMPGSEEN